MTLVNGIQTLSNHPYRHVDMAIQPMAWDNDGGGIDVRQIEMYEIRVWAEGRLPPCGCGAKGKEWTSDTG